MTAFDPAPTRPRIPAATWVAIVALGLSGQIAWNVENNWFNTFVFDTITPDSRPIAAMTAVSAIVATVTTLLMGASSDRSGRRKPFIVAGYVAWALSTALFPAAALPQAVGTAVFLVIVLDALMTFFGSTANDAAFNAWVTDVSAHGNRGLVEGVLGVMPVLATMIGMGVSGVVIDRFGYTPFFLVLGGLVLAMGLLGGALVKDAPRPVTELRGGVWRAVADVLSPTEVRRHPELYLVFVTMLVFFTGVQISQPYEVIYLNHTVGISKSLVGLITAMVAPVLILFAIPVGMLTDRGRGFAVAFTGYAVAAIGFLGFSLSSSVVALTVFALMKSVGFLMVIVLGAWHRDLLPERQRGAYQGVRLIFMVMLPMILGPVIGSVITQAWGAEVTIDGRVGLTPPPAVYWASGVVVACSLIPVALLRRRHR